MDCCVCVLVETLFARKTGEMFFYDQGQSFVRVFGRRPRANGCDSAMVILDRKL